MKMSELMPEGPRYLRAGDFEDNTVMRLRIEHIRQEQIAREPKVVLYFDGVERGFVLNRTNLELLIEVHGDDDPQNLEGKEIILYRTLAKLNDKMVPALRIRKVEESDKALVVVDPQENQEENKEDDIPF